MHPLLALSAASDAPVAPHIITHSLRERGFVLLEPRQVAYVLPAEVLPGGNPSQHKVSMKYQQNKRKCQADADPPKKSEKYHIGVDKLDFCHNDDEAGREFRNFDEDEEIEEMPVLLADAVGKQKTMMIECEDASPAVVAMFGSEGL